MKAECLELQGDIEYQDQIKDYYKAIQYYGESAKANPDNVEVYIKWAKTHEKVREFDEAISLLKKALRREPRSFVANYRIGLCYIRNNEKTFGINALKTAMSINPNDGDVLLKLGEIYLRDDAKIREAHVLIQNVIKIDPELPEAYILMGRIFEKEEQDDEALEAFKKGLHHSQGSNCDKKSTLQAHFHLGCQYERIKEFK